MLNTKKTPLIKKPLKKLKWQNKLFIKKSKHNLIKNVFIGLLITFFFCISIIIFNKYSFEKDNEIIDSVLIQYVSNINNKDYEKVKMLYFANNKDYTNEYINMLEEKIKNIGFLESKINTIYPAMINGNLSIVKMSTESFYLYKNQNKNIFEINTFILIKKGDKWFFALPEDLDKYNKEYLINLMDSYDQQIKISDFK